MEILSPAGKISSAYAAFIGGADAIYIGGKSFSARASIENFSNEEIESIVNFAHSIGKKVYVTINTLIFQDEFMDAVNFAYFLYTINIDGIIIQDLGLAYYLHKTLPSLTLHASTQLNCHNVKQAKALIDLGFKRIVVSREANIDTIKEIKALGVEVEVFVHGALCVSYSGNCLLSSFIGDRSGNRGRCAQPCRMKYDLKEDNKTISSNSYLISTKDLMGIDQLSALEKIKVDSLKIEGRVKSDEYIYVVSKAYKDALLKMDKSIIDEDKNQLIKTFNRQFTNGYLFNESPFKLLNTNTSSHIGELIGKVIKINNNRVSIKLYKDISRLDGIRFNNDEQFGLSLEKIFVNKNPVEYAKKGQIIEVINIEKADRLLDLDVYRTKDYLLTKEIEKQIKNNIKVGIKAKFIAHKSQPISLELSFKNHNVIAFGDIPDIALKTPTTKERIIEQLNKTNEYPYFIKSIKIEIDDLYIPISSINKLRNEALEKLKQSFIEHKQLELINYEQEQFNLNNDLSPLAIVNNINQEQIINNYGILSYSSFDNDYHNELRVNNKKNFNSKNELMHFIVNKENDCDLIGSMYLNVTNSYALDCLYHFGFNHIILSLELDFKSIQLLINDYYLRHNQYPSVGLLSYGYFDMMIMKSCPIGTIYQNQNIHCNKCHKHTYKLVDRINEEYRLIGDENCNIHVLSNKPICLFNKLDELEKLNIKPILIFNFEDEQKTMDIINSYYEKRNIPNSFNGHFLKRPL